MKTIYFVTEGHTDRIVLEGLVASWLGAADYIARHIQPPSSDYAKGLDSNLSQGWKGVLAWCRGERMVGPAGRDQALALADCLVIHIDADVALDAQFKTPALPVGTLPRKQSDWVRAHLAELLGDRLPSNVVLCVPCQDLEAWVLTALHPDVSDAHAPIEYVSKPATLLPRRPHKLTRFQNGELKKVGAQYRLAVDTIVTGWPHCTNPAHGRCLEAERFEDEARAALDLP